MVTAAQIVDLWQLT